MPGAIQAGMDYKEIWDYDFRELKLIIVNLHKRQARQNFDLASCIAIMMGYSMNGKGPAPTLYKVYPELFAAELEEEQYLKFRNALLAKAKKTGD